MDSLLDFVMSLCAFKFFQIPQINTGEAYSIMALCTDSEVRIEYWRLPRTTRHLTDEETQTVDRDEDEGLHVTILSSSTTLDLNSSSINS